MSASLRAGHHSLTERRHAVKAPYGALAACQLRERRTQALAASFECAAPPKRLALFVSGGGSNFKQIHRGCLDGSIRGDVVVRIKQQLTATALYLARRASLTAARGSGAMLHRIESNGGRLSGCRRLSRTFQRAERSHMR